MTKKDYILIAEAFKRIKQKLNELKNGVSAMDSIKAVEYGEYWINETSNLLADYLKLDNNRFNKDKFLLYIEGVIK